MMKQRLWDIKSSKLSNFFLEALGCQIFHSSVSAAFTYPPCLTQADKRLKIKGEENRNTMALMKYLCVR